MFVTIFTDFPASIFFAILFGLMVRFLMISFSFKSLLEILILGFLGWLWILFLWKAYNHPMEYSLSILPFAWIGIIILCMLLVVWVKIRKPIHEGILTLNLIALLYGCLEWSARSIYDDDTIRFLLVGWPLLLWALYNNFSSKRLSNTQQFVIVLINTLFISVLGGLYIWELFSISLTDNLTKDALLINIWTYVLFWFNVLFISQQFWLLFMVIPDKNSPLKSMQDAAIEYDKHYTTKIQTHMRNYSFFIILVWALCVMNFFLQIVPPIALIGWLLALWSIFEISRVREFLFFDIKHTSWKSKKIG